MILGNKLNNIVKTMKLYWDLVMKELERLLSINLHNTRSFNYLKCLLYVLLSRNLINPLSTGSISRNQNWTCWKIQSTQSIKFWQRKIHLFCNLFKARLGWMNDIIMIDFVIALSMVVLVSFIWFMIIFILRKYNWCQN